MPPGYLISAFCIFSRTALSRSTSPPPTSNPCLKCHDLLSFVHSLPRVVPLFCCGSDWKRTGGKPFADVEFLLQSVKRMNGYSHG